MKPGWGYLTFGGLYFLAAWFAKKADLSWLMWSLMVAGLGLTVKGLRNL